MNEVHAKGGMRQSLPFAADSSSERGKMAKCQSLYYAKTGARRTLSSPYVSKSNTGMGKYA